MFVFDPGFEKSCEDLAKQIESLRNDPNLLGYFSDNELPFSREALKNYLSLPDQDPGHIAAATWVRSKHGAKVDVKHITEKDQEAFLEFLADRYFRIVSSSLKKHDPHHMFLGCRFYSADYNHPEVFRAAGKYVDVVSVNYYHAWTPDAAKLESWEREAGKPILITEWYAKALDSGLANMGGAGWVVKTQSDRGRYYQNFGIGLLESKVCVGWHWFKYTDNDPDDRLTDPSNRDSNKGILNNRYDPYQPLLDAMKQLNLRAYSLINYFDGGKSQQLGVLKAGDKGD
jgi:hypothetical protein